MTPLVSRVGAVAYGVDPSVRKAIPPADMEALLDIEHFWRLVHERLPDLEQTLRDNPLIQQRIEEDRQDRADF